MKLGNIILVVCILLGAAFLTSLGVWQMNRLSWKLGLVERVQQNLSSPPLVVEEIAARVSAGEDIEYRPMKARGSFLHDYESHYFATHMGQSGYYVYTPLLREDGSILMVNRGYTPPEKKDNATRTEGLPDGVVELVGLARSAPTAKPNSFVPDNDLPKNVFYWKSLLQMLSRIEGQNAVKTQPFFMDVNNTPVPGRWPLGGVTRIEFPNSHLQYAMTWFGLALTLLVVGGFFLFGRIREAQNNP